MVAMLNTLNGRVGLTSPAILSMPQNVKMLCDALGFKYPQPLAGTTKYVSQEVVVPQIAEAILRDHHIDRNRHKKPPKIEQYATDMNGSNWVATHQGIAFNVNAKLYDGQNRLHACVMSDTPFETVVFFNVVERAMSRTDLGGQRTTCEAAHIEGKHIRKTDAALVRSVIYGEVYGSVPSPSHVFMVREDGVRLWDFMREQFPVHLPGKTIAPVLAAIARAYFHVGLTRLAEFCKCIREQAVTREDDRAVLHLLAWLGRQSQGRTGHAFNAEAFLKTEKAIQLFVERRCPTKLVSASEDIFPLPAEIAAKWNPSFR